MIERLFIIEAPGKIRHLGKLLFQLYASRCEVMATCGHLCENPAGLNTQWLDSGFTETSYSVKSEKKDLVARIHAAALIADEVYIATDDDDEGHVIARDIYLHCLADIKKPVYRLPLRALTLSEIKNNSTTLYDVSGAAANKGDARRIFDRLVGSLSDERGAVGRVQSSLLIELATYSPIIGLATYQLADANGGQPWNAIEPVFACDPDTGNRFIIDDVSLSAGRSEIVSGASQFCHFADLVLKTSLTLDKSPAEIAAAMQKLYERGELTYPRSIQHAVTQDSISRLSMIARLHNVGFDASRVIAVRDNNANGHEAPVPIKIDFPLHRDLTQLDVETATLCAISRAQLATGILFRHEYPAPSSLSRLPGELQSMQWFRQRPLRQLFWDQQVKPGLKMWTPEQSLLHFMSSHYLGRPSTLITHINKFIERELVNADFSFNEKGESWAFNATVKFHDKNISEIVERYLQENEKIPQEMVRELIALCSLDVTENRVTSSRNDLEQDLFDEYSDI